MDITIDELRRMPLRSPQPGRMQSATGVMFEIGRRGKPFNTALAEMHQSATNFNDLCLMIRGAMYSGPDSMEPTWRARYRIVKRQWLECTRNQAPTGEQHV